jgi:EF-P beta-lysylation protein EpmB
MIPQTLSPLQPPAWQTALRGAVSDPAELLQLLELSPDDLPLAAMVNGFPLRVPRGFVSRMRKRDPNDPLLRQVLPLRQELEDVPGFSDDAVGDLERVRAGGILHKYHGRALLIATGACAVHCRYCFRRHFPYGEHTATRHAWQETLAALSADASITEVILSGGDPLSLSDRRLAELAALLEGIPQLRRLRIHTRLPVVLPERVDAGLLGWLGRGRLLHVVVLHANHAQEIDSPVREAFQRLRDAGITLLNQSVLLRGINDKPQILADLSERLFECGVMPYYLHQLDRVRGAAHFEVPDSEATGIMREMASRLPGYLVPRLVRERAGQPYKLQIAW